MPHGNFFVKRKKRHFTYLFISVLTEPAQTLRIAGSWSSAQNVMYLQADGTVRTRRRSSCATVPPEAASAIAGLKAQRNGS